MKTRYALFLSVLIAGVSYADNSKSSFSYVGSYSSQNLESYVYTNYFCNTGNNHAACEANLAHLKRDFNFTPEQVSQSKIQSVKAFDVVYQTPGVDNKNREVSGGVIVPDTDEKNIKGVVIFYHPTEITKYNVPSCFMSAKNLPDYCNIKNGATGSNYIMELGAIFATQGYIVVMPDYIGQGIDDKIMHPYVAYPKPNVMSGLNMLQPTRKILKSLGYNNKKLNLFLSGYSEGGAYALWASRFLQNNESKRLKESNFTLAMAAPISGAYDLVNAQIPMVFNNNVNYPSKSKYNTLVNYDVATSLPIISSYMLNAIAYYSMDKSATKVFTPQFANMDCGESCTVMIGGKPQTISELYQSNDSQLNVNNISTGIINSAFHTINPENKTVYGPNNNSIISFTAPGLMQNAIFNKTVQDASIVTWKTQNPVSLIYLYYDSCVTNLNSNNAYNGMIKMSDASLVKRVPINNFDYMNNVMHKDKVYPIDHNGNRIFLFTAALKEFNGVKQE